MKPRPARGAIRPGRQRGEQKHEQCDEQDDVHFFPRLSGDLQLADGASGSATGRRQTEMGDLCLEILRGPGTKGR
jgi:hypothetical protein